MLMNKRTNPTYKNGIVQQKNEYQEEIEDTKEDGEINGSWPNTTEEQKGNQEGGVGTVETLTTTREIVQAWNTSIATYQDTWKETAGKERLIWYWRCKWKRNRRKQNEWDKKKQR